VSGTVCIVCWGVRAGDRCGQPCPRRFGETVRLRDGTTGFYTRRSDDCLMAAIATVLQAADAPDLRIDARLGAGASPRELDREVRREVEQWLAGRGWRMVVHPRAPGDMERYIGVVPIGGWFQSHCLVLCRGELLHDPAARCTGFISRLLKVKLWGPEDVTWGISFVQKTNR
jgi:hypothetical protein